jgi:hypothetical protein
MNSSESIVHSFIVKIWVEELKSADLEANWHGQITHVPSNERCYINDLGDISSFIKPYLGAMSVKDNQK